MSGKKSAGCLMRCSIMLSCFAIFGTLGACGGGQDNPDASGPDAPDTAECTSPLPLACGDSFNHSTITNGRANLWSAYGCTARLENGRETVYRLAPGNDCLATVTLSNLTTDLDVLRLATCDPWAATDCASTPVDIQDDEVISFLEYTDEASYIVVDGYDGSEGSYTIDVDCDCGEPIDDYTSVLVECAFQYVDSTPTTHGTTVDWHTRNWRKTVERQNDPTAHEKPAILENPRNTLGGIGHFESVVFNGYCEQNLPPVTLQSSRPVS